MCTSVWDVFCFVKVWDSSSWTGTTRKDAKVVPIPPSSSLIYTLSTYIYVDIGVTHVTKSSFPSSLLSVIKEWSHGEGLGLLMHKYISFCNVHITTHVKAKLARWSEDLISD